MASNGQKDKVGDEIPAGSEKHVDPNVEEEVAIRRFRTRITARKTSARMATCQRNKIEADTTTRTTSEYGRIDACGGTKR